MAAPSPDVQCLLLPIADDADSLRARRAVIQLLPHLNLDHQQEWRLVAVCYGLAEHALKQHLPASMRLMLRAEGTPALRIEVRPETDAEGAPSWPTIPAAELLETGLAALLEQFMRVECRAARGRWMVAFEQSLGSAMNSMHLPELISTDRVPSPDPLAELRAVSAAHLEAVAAAAQLEQEVRKHEGRSRQLQAELLETNQGVLALYSELEDHVAKLRDLNETLEQRVAERTAEAQQRAEQLRMLAWELSQTEQRERKRLAQILHDHLQQLLVAARMSISELRRRMQGQAPAPTNSQGPAQIVDRIDTLLSESIEASRSLTVELSPPILHDAGLVPALHWLVRQQEEKHGLRVHIQTQPDAEPGSEDMKVLLFQVVRELLFNTVKHAGVREAQVELTRREDQLQIVVADEGAGFELRGLRQKPEGSFGLFSIRERLRLLGAEMSIDTGVDRGTRVTLVAPLRPAEQHTGIEAGAARDAAAEAGPEPAPKIRLLLADDHRSLRASFSRLFRHEADIELVGEAADGETTIEMAHRLRPDVVLMDVSMPRIGGIEATRRITRQLPHTRVIALSMHQDSDTEAAMREAGAAAYMLKDAPSNELLAAVRRCAGRSLDERQN